MRRFKLDEVNPLEEILEDVTDDWGELLPLSEWPVEVLVDIEIIVNGELQRRGG